MVDKENVSWDNAMFVTMDLHDDVNVGIFKTEVLSHALAPTALSQWDALSFNREPYYDFWSLRYSGYDDNILAHGGKDGWWKFTQHKEFGETVLDTSPLKFFPVYSAFNGLALHKLKSTVHCEFIGEHAWDDLQNHAFIEDADHVSFQKCMTSKNDAKVMIFNEKLLNVNVLYSEEALEQMAQKDI